MDNLWQDYWFLTNEIEKFLLKQDFEMVNELLNQREMLQKTIDAANSSVFLASSEGKSLLKQIDDKNHSITQILHLVRNKSQQLHSVANAYGNLGMGNSGYRMDNKS